MATMDNLEIELSVSTQEAVKAIKSLNSALNSISKNSQRNGVAFDTLAQRINRFANSTSLATNQIKEMASALKILGSANLTKVGSKVNEIAREMQGASSVKIPEVKVEAPQIPQVADSDTAQSIAIATEKVRKYDDAFIDITADSPPAANNVKRVGNEAKKAGSKARQGAKGLKHFGEQIKNIIKYRIVRRILTELGTAMKEGLTNLYNYSKAMGSLDSLKTKATLDAWATSWLKIKNTLGVTMMSVITSIMPLLEKLTNMLIQAADAVNMFFAAISGSGTYTKAVDYATEWAEETSGAAKEVKRTLLGFDEINQLQDNNSGGSGANTPDYSKMFEEVEIPTEVLDMVKQIQKIFGRIKKHLDNIFSSLENIWKSKAFQKLITGAIELVLMALETPLEFISDIFDAIDAFANGNAAEGIKKIAEAFGDLVFNIMKVHSKGGDTVLEMFGIKSDTSAYWDDVKNSFDTWLDTGDMSGFMEIPQNAIDGKYGDLAQWFITKEKQITEGTVHLKEAWEIFFRDGDPRGLQWFTSNALNGEYGNAFQWVAEQGLAVSEFISGVKESFGAFADWFKDTWGVDLRKIFDDFKTFMKNPFVNAAKMARNAFKKTIKWFDNTFGTNLEDAFANFEEFMKDPFGNAATWIKEKFKGLLTWFDGKFNTDLTGAFSKFEKFMEDPFGNSQTWIINKYKELTTWFDSTFGTDLKSTCEGFEAFVKDPFGEAGRFIKNKFKDLCDWFRDTFGVDVEKIFSKVQKFIQNPFKEAKTFAQNKFRDLKNWFRDTCIPKIKEVFDSLPDGLKKSLIGAFNAVATGLNTAIKGAITVANLFVAGNNAIHSLDPDYKAASMIDASQYTIKLAEFATGGFPSAGELFVGNENGIEMMGQMGNRNVVANNQQIVDGIKQGVFEAVASAMSQNRNNNSQPIIENVFKVDSEVLYKATRRGEAKYNGRYTTSMVF